MRGELRLAGVDGKISEGPKLRLGEALEGETASIGLFRLGGTLSLEKVPSLGCRGGTSGKG